MKTKIKPLGFTGIMTLCAVVITLFAATGCEQTSENNSSIQYLTSVLGGCNNALAMRSYSEENDTVVISVGNDNNIHVFVGKNYTCGAVFETQCEIKNDTIFMCFIDNGTVSYERCSCYYTFDFIFKPGELNQKYKIVLIDPRKETPEIIEEGNIQDKII